MNLGLYWTDIQNMKNIVEKENKELADILQKIYDVVFLNEKQIVIYNADDKYLANYNLILNKEFKDVD